MKQKQQTEIKQMNLQEQFKQHKHYCLRQAASIVYFMGKGSI